MITIYFNELPFDDVYGVSQKSKNGDYTVLINTNKGIPDKIIIDAIRHEMNHIRLNHFDSDRPLKEIELEANEGYPYAEYQN